MRERERGERENVEKYGIQRGREIWETDRERDIGRKRAREI